MQRIVVDDYPSKAEDCPLAEFELIENEYGLFERHKCKCSGACALSVILVLMTFHPIGHLRTKTLMKNLRKYMATIGKLFAVTTALIYWTW